MKNELDDLLAPISEEQACGVDLREETDFYVLEELAAGKEDTQFSEAEPPDWQKVEGMAAKLFQQSKDLWILHYYIASVAELYQLTGILHGITLLKETISIYWDELYPLADKESDEPDLERINILKTMFVRTGSLYAGLNKTVISASKQLGKFTYNDYLVATDKLKPAEGKEKIQPNMILAAIKDSDPEFIAETEQQIDDLKESIDSLKAFLEEKEVDDSGLIESIELFETNLNELASNLSEISQEDIEETSSEEEYELDEEYPDAGAGTSKAKTVKLSAKGITDHADIIRILNQIYDWYEMNEPSSPVPYLLKRAEELIGKDFVEIMENVASSALPEVRHLFNLPGGAPAAAAPHRRQYPGGDMQEDSYMDEEEPEMDYDEGPEMNNYNEPSYGPRGPMDDDMYGE